MSMRLKSWLILNAITTVALGCSNSGGSALASAADSDGLTSSFTAYQKLASTPIYTSAMSTIASSDLMSYYKSSVASANNSTFRLGSHTFSHLKDFYAALAPQMQKNAAKFKNPGALWQNIGLDSHADISIAQYNDGLSIYDRISEAFDSGKSIVLTADDAALLGKVAMVTLGESLTHSSAALGFALETVNFNVQSGGLVQASGSTTTDRSTTTTVDCRSNNLAVVNQYQSGCGTNNNNNANNNNSGSISGSGSVENTGSIAASGVAASASGHSANVASGLGSGGGSGSGSGV